MTSLEEYLYQLPESKIARYPLAERDLSKLLKYQDGQISHHAFRDVKDVVPKGSLLMFNNTKVIAARLFFTKTTGARIEIFLTEPVSPHPDFQLALKTKKSCTWRCMIGNAKKWKEGTLSMVVCSESHGEFTVKATLENREQNLVRFDWDTPSDFLDIIESGGNVPLPPYLNREAEKDDKARYQTVFSELEGAVAAPTAGLHFTDAIIDELEENGIQTDYLTLHVSAGTFRPIKEKDFTNHPMHNEKIIITRQNLEHLLSATGRIIPVGTTAMRTLESTYWYGAKLLKDDDAGFHIEKNAPYEAPVHSHPTMQDALQAVLDKMQSEKRDTLAGETEIFIYPGYDFKVCSGLFTNYHQPGSTLILLVAAFIGDDWKKIYQEALAKDYRFLSYGDTSLLLK
ncbi:MAG: S-adenosylmethionine:tRNA ribosyltransferase-isomerase [Cyclobacteriaceae bacterium]